MELEIKPKLLEEKKNLTYGLHTFHIGERRWERLRETERETKKTKEAKREKLQRRGLKVVNLAKEQKTLFKIFFKVFYKKCIF